ncbi:MAG: PHP domain-containing protein [Spirochaetales bacterium]|nr:PHP domain-containing protein [Spirochaetales bacterium]
MSSREELNALSLDGATAVSRLHALDVKLAKDRAAGFLPPSTGEVNNHIHTVYSFSPYTPSEAVYGAWRAGLEAVGIVDHESVAGCQEMLQAGQLLGLGITTGCELRVSAKGTALEGRRINNPDSDGLFYMVIHGIPHQHREEVEAFLAPIRESRNDRMREQTQTLNAILEDAGCPALDFHEDVMAVSLTQEGGSITERHILYALSQVFTETFGRGTALMDALENSLGLPVSTTVAERLQDESNPHYLYDLLGLFKGALVPRFFRQPDEKECPPVTQATALAEHIGAIATYAYLGDVGESPTGDKKAEHYEDAWLEELFALLPQLGFRGLSYMPPRNTREQLERVKNLCTQHGLMEISGVDINSSRQEFRCPQVTQPEFAHLNDRTWALIAHEQFASHGGWGLFDSTSPMAQAPLEIRLDVYARMGRRMNPQDPMSIIEAARKEGLWTESH